MSHPALSIQSVSRTFGVGETAVAALRNVSLEVAPGEFVAVMGPSGSGKSTLLAIAGGLDGSSSGEVVVDGHSLRGQSKAGLARIRRRHIGFVFQEYNLLPTLSVLENVALPLELDGVAPREAAAAAKEALRRVHVDELAGRYLDQVSGGQRQRVAIARAIVGERRLILADEPTGALDTVTGEDVVACLRDLAEQGIAVVMVTHDARLAAWADRIVFLRDGRVVDESAVESHADSLLVGA